MRKLSMAGWFSAISVVIGAFVAGAFFVPTSASAAMSCYEGATRDLYLYNPLTGEPADGEDVRNLQKVFNNDLDTLVAATSDGSPGNETTHFGLRTRNAARKFQLKYGISPAEGYIGPITRPKLTELYGCGGGMTAYDYGRDGVADKLDEFFLRDLILQDGTCPAETVCDVNIDSQVTIADVVTLISYFTANRPTITVTTPTPSVQAGSAYTINWATTPRSINSGVNIRALKDGTIISDQQFGRLHGNLLYDYNSDGVVDKNDIYVLRDVVLGSQSCPVGKVCDVNGLGGVNISDITALTSFVLQYTALPDSGSFVWNVPASLALGGNYQVQIVAENDAGVVGTSGPFIVVAPPPPPPGTLTITKVGSGSVRSVSPVGDIDCGATCLRTYAAAQNIVLEAIPSAGYRFVSWTGCIPADTTQCSVSVSTGSSLSVAARFELIPPFDVVFTAMPTSHVEYNGATTLNWMTIGAVSCTASGGVGMWPGSKYYAGGNESTGPLTSDTTFTLSCSNSTGTVITKSVTVTVEPPPAVSFSLPLSAVPSSITSGGSAILSWSAQNTGPQPEPCTASGNWSGTKAKTGTESTGPLTTDRTYMLSCTGLGETVESSATVTIIPTIAVIFPSAGAQLEQGKSYTVSWTTEGSTGDGFDVTVLRSGAPVIGQRFTTTSATNPRTFVWSVPSTLSAGGGYAIRIEAVSNHAVQNTSGTFSVVPQPKIQVTSPNGGEAWNIGSITNSKDVTWKSTGIVGSSVNAVLKRQPGNIVVGSLTPSGIANNQGNNISPQSNALSPKWQLAESWLVSGGGYVIEICNTTRTVCDESDATFTILDEIPKIAFTSLTLSPSGDLASPYTIGETMVSYSAALSNNGVRSVSNLTLAVWIEQGSARSGTVELPLSCLTQAVGTMAPGVCVSESLSQRLFISNGIGQLVRGPAQFVAEARLGGSPLAPPAQPAKKTVAVQLYPPPAVQVLFPNGPAIVQGFALGQQVPVRWKTQGLIDRVTIKIKQAGLVPLYDFNNDGAVNEHDAVFLGQFTTLTACNVAALGKNCDVNGDGELAVSDPIWLTGNVLLSDPLRYIDRVEMFDFDGNNVFDNQDNARLAQLMSTNTLSQCFSQTGKNCDVNRDGTYTIADTLYLQNILGIPPPDTILPGTPSASNFPNNKDQETIYSWTPLAPFVLPAGNYKIVVCDLSRPAVCDESDNTFLIYAGPPTITSPTGPPPSSVQVRKFSIQEDMNIVVDATHPLSFSQYKIGLYQNSQLIYENVRDAGSASVVPFSVNNTLVRLSDGKRVIDFLQEGQLRIVVSGRLMSQSGGGMGYTNSAERIVQLEFDRKSPVFQSPTPGENQEVNLGKVPIPVAATHGANPKRYELVLFQNGANVFQQIINAQPNKFSFEFSRDTRRQSDNRKVFDLLQEGEVRIIVKGQLLDGSFTSPATRSIRVIPVPPDLDLNSDGDVDVEDFKVLQLTILGERMCPTEKDCDLNRDGAVNVADLATLVAHPLYQKPAPAPSVPAVGAMVLSPTVISPQSGASWSVSDPVVIKEVAGATGYLVGFIRNQQLVHENYRDENKSLATTAGADGTRVYRVSSAAYGKFTVGTMYIYVRALVNNQWTDAAVVPVYIGTQVAAPQQQAVTMDPTRVTVLSPVAGEEWVRANSQQVIIQPYPGATAYHFRFRTVVQTAYARFNVVLTESTVQGASLASQGGNLVFSITPSALSQFFGDVFLDVLALVGGTTWTPETIVGIRWR